LLSGIDAPSGSKGKGSPRLTPICSISLMQQGNNESKVPLETVPEKTSETTESDADLSVSAFRDMIDAAKSTSVPAALLM